MRHALCLLALLLPALAAAQPVPHLSQVNPAGGESGAVTLACGKDNTCIGLLPLLLEGQVFTYAVHTVLHPGQLELRLRPRGAAPELQRVLLRRAADGSLDVVARTTATPPDPALDQGLREPVVRRFVPAPEVLLRVSLR